MGYHRGYSPSPETRAKMRASQLGRTHTAEHKEKIRQAKLGSKVSEETKQKISATMRERWRKGAHAGKLKSPVPDHLKGYASKLRHIGIKGDEFRRAIEAAQ